MNAFDRIKISQMPQISASLSGSFIPLIVPVSSVYQNQKVDMGDLGSYITGSMISMSYALTSSHALFSISSSHSITSSYSFTSVSSSHADYSDQSYRAVTASNATTAYSANTATSASYALTASFSQTSLSDSKRKIEVYCPSTPTGGTKAHFDVEVSSNLTFSAPELAQSSLSNQTGFYYFNGLIYQAFPATGIDVDVFGDQSVIFLFDLTNANTLFYRIRAVVNLVPGDWEAGTL